MPNPTAPPPPPPEKKLPSNLDDLVRKAMTGGGLRALQEALSRSQPEPALPPPPAQPTVVPPLSAAPSPPRAAVAPPISQPSPYTFPDGQSHYHRPPPPPPVPAPPQATPPPPSRPLPPEPEERGTDPGLNLPKKEVSAFDPFAAGDPLPELPAPEQASPAPEFDGSENLFDTDVDPLALLEEAVLAVRGAEFPMVALAEVEQRLDAVYRKLRPQKIVLPPFRFQYLLAVEHAAPETYVSGLGLDLPTARALSATGAPRVALRGDNRLELERRCQKGRALGLRAQVLDKEQLREAMVWLVLSSPAAGKLAVTGEPLWEDPPDPGSWPPDRVLRAEDFRLAIPGEVVSQRQKAGHQAARWERKRYTAAGSTQEQRASVLDIHSPMGILRFVEGITQFSGLPGEDPNSQRRSRQGFQELLQAGGLTVLPRRSCAPTGATTEEDGSTTSSGWPIWEEHTRICRLFYL